jgi:[ribosomal protein S5]-alanine N-acetyltransferase
MTFEYLNTSRLLLRKLSPETVDYIYKNYTNKQLIAFLGLKDEVQLAIEKVKFESGLTTFNKSFLYFQLLDKKSEAVVGWCGFHTWYLDHHRAEIGYGLFDESLKNNGIMTEALKVIIEYGFNQMKLNRIEAFVGTKNIPSLKLMEKFSFTKEGILRKHYLKNTILEDSVVYSLLKEEYI